MVLRSPQGPAKMMEVIVEVCRAFALTVSANDVYASTADDGASRSSGANLLRGVILYLPKGRRDLNPGHVC